MRFLFLLDSSVFLPSENTARERRDTYTTRNMNQPSDIAFIDRKFNYNKNTSVLQEIYKKQDRCQECVHRHQTIQYERQQRLYLYEENKRLTEQLRSSKQLNRQYEEDIQNLKYYLKRMNSYLYEYQFNFDQLKQKIASDKKTNPKINEEKQVEIVEVKQDTIADHLKRLRHEIDMYNRLVAAKQQQEQKNIRKNIELLL